MAWPVKRRKVHSDDSDSIKFIQHVLYNDIELNPCLQSLVHIKVVDKTTTKCIAAIFDRITALFNKIHPQDIGSMSRFSSLVMNEYTVHETCPYKDNVKLQFSTFSMLLLFPIPLHDLIISYLETEMWTNIRNDVYTSFSSITDYHTEDPHKEWDSRQTSILSEKDKLKEDKVKENKSKLEILQTSASQDGFSQLHPLVALAALVSSPRTETFYTLLYNISLTISKTSLESRRVLFKTLALLLWMFDKSSGVQFIWDFPVKHIFYTTEDYKPTHYVHGGYHYVALLCLFPAYHLLANSSLTPRETYNKLPLSVFI